MKLLEREAPPAPAADSAAATRRRSRRLAFLGRVPRAAWACAAIAFAHSALWAAVIPSFQVPDEIDHSAYVQYVAERGDLPTPAQADPPSYALDLAAAAGGMPFSVEGRPTWSPFDARRYDQALADASSRPDGVGPAAVNNPPVYYLLGAVPYRALRGADYPDRLFAMRLVSALLMALTVLFTFLFVREVLPGTPWAWTLGALAVAFQPVVAFMGGGVNNDTLLYAAGSALLFVLARAFRRGLTPALGLGLGLALLTGLMTKSTFLGLVPGVVLGCALLVWRAGERRRPALAGAGLAAAVALVPFQLWTYVNEHVFDRSATTTAGFNDASVTQAITLSGQLSYTWQWFLPELPFMQEFDMPDYPVWDTFFQAFVGRFGWFQYGFPTWVSWVALGVVLALAGLAAAAIGRAHVTRSGRWGELVTYAALLGGLVALVNVAGYRFLAVHEVTFEQVRYLFPLIALWGLLIAVAVRGAGRRFGPALAGLLVVLLVGHSLFSMLLTLSRYYA